MKKVFFVGFIVIGLVMIGISVFWFVKGRQTGVSAVQVTSLPQAAISIDGQPIGKTPFRENAIPGEHIVRLVPEGMNNAYFEQKIVFLPNILTVIDRSFTETGSHGHILSLSPLPEKKDVEIAIISTPTGATVSLDSELKGITPILLKDVTSSDHELIVAKEGYLDKIIRVKTVTGYKLNVAADLGINLAPAPASPSGLPATPTPQATQQIRIVQTPTGFLRVRFEPSLSATEVARVNPGEIFPLLAEQGTWVKIKLPNGKEGWISSQYAQKLSQ